MVVCVPRPNSIAAAAVKILNVEPAPSGANVVVSLSTVWPWPAFRPYGRLATSANTRRVVSPVVASTDYMKAYAEQIRPFIPKGRTYKVLGTDGFGRSDFRSKLREHFEINRHYIVVAALKALSEEGTVPAAKVAEAIKKYGIKADKINPLYA